MPSRNTGASTQFATIAKMHPLNTVLMDATPQPRRPELDWLRVIVFGLLILYHIGMVYVENWGYHVKSAYRSETLESVMLLVNQWRLPILWFISGVAMRYAVAKFPLTHFIRLRSLRLLLPLLFGILVIVPPQLFVEMSSKGDIALDYWAFYRAFFILDNPIFDQYTPGIFPHMDVNHLWYLRELWIFSLVILLLTPILHMRRVKNAVHWLCHQQSHLLILLAIISPFVLMSLLMQVSREQEGFGYLLLGYLLAYENRFWQRIARAGKHYALAALFCYGLIVMVYLTLWQDSVVHTDWRLLLPLMLIAQLNTWCWILGLFAFAARYLNRHSSSLSYLNQAVLPYYILHQSFIVVYAYLLADWQFGPMLESSILILLTIISCALGYEGIRRVRVLRPLFGLPWYTRAERSAPENSGRVQQQLWRFARVLTYLALIPFGLKILL